MSVGIIWLLFILVVGITLIFVSLSKTKFTTQKIAMIGLMAALSFVAYEFFRIPYGSSGASFHLGNTFTVLTALLLDGVSGGLAGAIGLSLADIVAGYPGYAITTFILKFIIGWVSGTVAHKVVKINEHPRLLNVTVAAASGLIVNVFTDPFLGYFRNRFIFGQPVEIADVLVKITAGVTLTNSILSTIFAVLLFYALRPVIKGRTASK